MSITRNVHQSTQWADFKQFITDLPLSIHLVDDDTEMYNLFAIDGAFVVLTTIAKTSPRNADQIDFEDNYKSNGNNKNSSNVLIADPVSGVKAKVTAAGKLESTASIGSVDVNELLAKDYFADTWAGVLNPGVLNDTARTKIDDDSVNVLTTVNSDDAADATGVTLRDHIITDCNNDATFKALYKATPCGDGPYYHIASLQKSEAGEHLDTNDFQVVTTGSVSIDIPSGNDVIKPRFKPINASRNSFDRRYAAISAVGDMSVVQGSLDDVEPEAFCLYSGSKDMNIDGTIPKTFSIGAHSTKTRRLKSLTFVMQGGTIKTGQFGPLSSKLTNGIEIKIKANDIVTTFELVKSTEDLEFNWSRYPEMFTLKQQAGNDTLVAVRMFPGSLILKPQGTFSIDDYINVKIQDDLSNSAQLKLLRCIADIFYKEFD